MLLGFPNCPPKLLHSLFLHFLANGFERSMFGNLPLPLWSLILGPDGPETTVILSRPETTVVTHLPNAEITSGSSV
jgi:hypothetical protein